MTNVESLMFWIMSTNTTSNYMSRSKNHTSKSYSVFIQSEIVLLDIITETVALQ